ncbi:MAG: FAD-dependent oxidoreductase [Candidatus Omnitrophica bacterium]|nr:FAD-dependent oxidoreductase [Candidatus Omnitrophota bacterium]
MTPKPEPLYYDVTLRRVVDLGNDTRHFELAFDPGRTMPFLPGQFAVVICPKDGKLIRRAYSIASAPRVTDRLELIVKLVQNGVVTPWFWTLKEGDRLRVQGPFGKFVLPEKVDFDILFVAVGTGIAPFRSMIQQMLPAGFDRRIWLLFGTRYDTMIPYHKEFLALAREYPQLVYIPTISRPGPQWQGETGYVQTKIEKLFPDPAGMRIYICGLNEMIQAVQEAALQLGYRKDQIQYEKYD